VDSGNKVTPCPYSYSGNVREFPLARLMAAILLFKMSLVGIPSADRCGKRSFPHKDDSRVYIELSGEKMWFFLRTLHIDHPSHLGLVLYIGQHAPSLLAPTTVLSPIQNKYDHNGPILVILLGNENVVYIHYFSRLCASY
jgi:hypothetical protein